MRGSTSLAEFLSAGGQPIGIDLCLPEFEGSQTYPWTISGVQGKFGYPSNTLSNRDVKSALHVQSLLTRNFADESIELQSPQQFLAARQQQSASRVGMLFGSRSNIALQEAGVRSQLGRLLTFDFGAEWTIIGKDQQRFSITDPSTLTRAEYESKTDYCVVARLRANNDCPLFIIAGLGGRATEGGGRYLAQNWEQLHQEFVANDFAVVLSFVPPVSPSHFQVAARYRCD
jgi:hypothetical protein